MRRCYYCGAKILDGEFVCFDCAERLEERLKGGKKSEGKRGFKRRSGGDFESDVGDWGESDQ